MNNPGMDQLSGDRLGALLILLNNIYGYGQSG
ncbi:hypothetical protein Pse7367_2224 [Thalassoporum mexicanum PCC 7367]|nr:hypothetical protein Pse7367_2224 [Pseudanabaena sp. PCC 7367]